MQISVNTIFQAWYNYDMIIFREWNHSIENIVWQTFQSEKLLEEGITIITPNVSWDNTWLEVSEEDLSLFLLKYG